MGKLVVQLRNQPAVVRVLGGMGAFVVLVLVVVLGAGNS